MKMSKILGAGIVVLSLGAVAAPASAAMITATWQGVLGYGYSNDYNTSTYTDLSGQSVQMTFTFDSDAPGTGYDVGYYQRFDTSYNNAFYSSASVSIGSGGPISLTIPSNGSTLLLGDPTKFYTDLYYNYAYGGNGNIEAYFYNFTGGTTSLDPAQTFSHAMTPSDVTYVYFSLYQDNAYYYGYGYTGYSGGMTSVNVTSDGVPAPGALALLGLGLIGLGAVRRKKIAA